MTFMWLQCNNVHLQFHRLISPSTAVTSPSCDAAVGAMVFPIEAPQYITEHRAGRKSDPQMHRESSQFSK